MVDNSNPALRESLSSALAQAHLEDLLEAAWNWCNKSGAFDLEELAAEDVFPEFCKDLELKKLQARRLLIAFQSTLKETRPEQSIGSASSRSAPGADWTLTEKNTFLDFEKKQPKLGEKRSNTVSGAPGADRTGSDGESDNDINSPSHVQAAAAAASVLSSPLNTYMSGAYCPFGYAPAPYAPNSSILASKLDTFDGYGFPEYHDERAAPGLTAEPDRSYPSEAAESYSAGTAQHSGRPANDFAEPTAVGYPDVSPAVLAQLHTQMQMQMSLQMAAAQQMQMAAATQMQAQRAWANEPLVSLADPAPDPKPRKDIIERSRWGSRCERLVYTVDAKKLRSKDREDVSPAFEGPPGSEAVIGVMQLKIILRPKAMDAGRGGAGFDASGKRGYIELKCVTDLENVGELVKTSVTFRMSVGSRRGLEPFRGPLCHDFAKRAICHLPAGQDEWNFGKAVDRSSNTFCVAVEFLDDD